MLNDFTIINASSTQTNSLFYIKNSHELTLTQSEFVSIDQLLVNIDGSSMIEFDKISVSDITQTISITQNSNVTITHSDFNNIGTDTIVDGGAVKIQNSNLTLNMTSFTNCTAKQGA